MRNTIINTIENKIENGTYSAKSRRVYDWTTRLADQIVISKTTYLITLTYDNENLKELSKTEGKEITKKLRKIKEIEHYYLTAEHGKQTYRPHIHILIYAKKDITTELKNLWKKGLTEIRQIDKTRGYQACAYIAGHAGKKNAGTPPKLKKTEYRLMSRGIGFELAKKHIEQINRTQLWNGRRAVPEGYKRKFLTTEEIKERTKRLKLSRTDDKEKERRQGEINGYIRMDIADLETLKEGILLGEI